MVKDHSDSKRGNPLPPHGLLFLISSKGSFICTDMIAHTTAFVTPVVGHLMEQEIAQWVICMECILFSFNWQLLSHYPKDTDMIAEACVQHSTMELVVALMTINKYKHCRGTLFSYLGYLCRTKV